MAREVEVFRGRVKEVLARRVRVVGGSMAALDSEKGTTPARRAISCSPSCQCMASAARQGMAISSATLDHISALNLWARLAGGRGWEKAIPRRRVRSGRREDLPFI